MSRPYLSPEEMQHLTPGVLDDAAAEFFANGHCASMALALHEITGWPLVSMDVVQESDDDDGNFRIARTGGHGVVLSPLGFLDALGPGALEGWARNHSLDRHSEYRVNLEHDYLYARQNIDLVFPFAEALLRKYFPDFTPQQLKRPIQLTFPFAGERP